MYFLLFLFLREKKTKESTKENKEKNALIVGFGGINRLRTLSKIAWIKLTEAF